MNRALQERHHRRRLRAGSHNENHERPGISGIGHVDSYARRPIQSMLMHIPHDTHHLAPVVRSAAATHSYHLIHRVMPGEDEACQRFVDQYSRSCVRAVMNCKAPALKKRYAHYPEILWTD